MHSSTTVFLLTLLTFLFLAPSTLACKCYYPGHGDQPWATKVCCEDSRGQFVDGVDCNAHSISEGLRQFSQCCAYKGAMRSDCHCSFGCHEPQAK